MKKVSILLLIFLLSSACLGSMSFAVSASEMGSDPSSVGEVQPSYSMSGNLSRYGLDYWWIRNVNQDETLTVGIETSASQAWRSTLYYSNATVAQGPYEGPWSHSHVFLAPKTDDYLLELYAGARRLNYNITCSHQMNSSTLYTESGSLSEHGLSYSWISNVDESDTLIVGIETSASQVWRSTLYYSNATVAQGPYEGPWSHSHVFLAPKTDDYLLELYAGARRLNVTIRMSHSRLPTELKCSIEPESAVIGQTVFLLGNISTTEGYPVPNEDVTIRVNGTYRGTLTTNSSGWFKASGKVKSVGTFNISVVYEGSPRYLPSSDWTTLIVNKVGTAVYAAFYPNPVNSGESFTLKGVLLDQFSNPMAVTDVTLEYSTDYGSTWHPAGKLTTNTYGIFSKTRAAPPRDIYLVKISYAGSPNYEPSTVTVPLIVR